MSDSAEDGVSRQGEHQDGETRLLTKKQLANNLQVTTRTIDRWILEGELPPESKVELGGVVRFHAAVIQAWISSRSEHAKD